MPVTVSTPAAQDAALSLSRPRPALRLVSTKGLARETWLDVRRQGIGSSDAAAAADSTTTAQTTGTLGHAFRLF